MVEQQEPTSQCKCAEIMKAGEDPKKVAEARTCAENMVAWRKKNRP